MWRLIWREEDGRRSDEVKDLVMGRRLSEREGMVLARDRVVWCIDWSRWEE